MAEAKGSQRTASKLDHNTVAEDALNRRGNNYTRDAVKDANRVYDPVAEKRWEAKYKYFGDKHMKGTYRSYARARHDPFNKDPTWAAATIANVSKACVAKGVAPRDLFSGLDANNDGKLDRPEVKRVLLDVLPTLSNMEVTAIFDKIDADDSGGLTSEEFCDLVEKGSTVKVDREAAERHRNPIYRFKRLPPARIEGWDHVLDQPDSGTRLDQFCDAERNKLITNLGATFSTSPRSLQHNVLPHKYTYAAGGSDRFRKQAWMREGRSATASGGTPRAFTSLGLVEDPGPDLRPGFLCGMMGSPPHAARGFSALTPRSAGAGTPRFR